MNTIKYGAANFIGQKLDTKLQSGRKVKHTPSDSVEKVYNTKRQKTEYASSLHQAMPENTP